MSVLIAMNARTVLREPISLSVKMVGVSTRSEGFTVFAMLGLFHGKTDEVA